ncbi:MobF family relaxase [Aeoliella sp.]|uniref:MobF family relaxase n=1 Tax=Aeoliella sp. TaxID=2795800 RepID=UPI003CCBE54F
MLSIKAISHTAGHVEYYANLGSAENHDYYSEEGVRPGRWWGEGAKHLGLEGVVSPQVFANLLEGKSPDGKRHLVQQNGTATRKRRAGFDLTWSVPKSLSVLWSQLSDSDRGVLDELAERALHRALEAYVELCGVARRGKNGHTLEEAKPVIAIFSHDTARAVPGEVPDANRHFHAIVANVCVRSDGTTGAVDSRYLFQRRMKMALGALFRAELARLLGEGLGLEVYRPERGRKNKLATWWELEGVPESAITAMSKRRQQIERWLKAHGLTGAKSSDKAAVATRQGKERYTWQELNTAWAELGEELGFGRGAAENLLSEGRQTPATNALPDIAAEAIQDLGKTKARFSENEIVEQAAILAQTRGIGIDGVLTSVKYRLAQSPEIVRLRDSRGVRAYTTRAMLEVEQRLLDCASRLSNNASHAVPPEMVKRVIQEASTLRPQQARCVRAMTLGSDVVSVTGLAGTGKTFALGVARKAFEEAGYNVIGTALASKAARGLEAGSGIPSVHLHSLLHAIDHQELSINPRTVIVVDEAGMVGTRMLDRLFAIVEPAGAKVVLVGDHRQLQAIDAGAPFRLISEQIGTTELTEIVRQREAWSRENVIRFRDGLAEEALLELHARGQLTITPYRDTAIDTIVADWRHLITSSQATLENTMILAGTNLEVEELNRRVQSELKALRYLGEYAVEVNGMPFRLGDRVLVTKNYRLLGLRNGTLGEVIGAWDSMLAVETEEGFVVEIDTREFTYLDLAYAVNGYKAQGVTLENALVLTGDSTTDREMAYVTASRARGKTLVYADEESVADIPELADRMSVSSQNEMAIEHLRQEVE